MKQVYSSNGIKIGLMAAIALILNAICFARSLKGYFLADDFVHIAYLHQALNGHMSSILENFWGNWMQTQGTCFYRPLITCGLLIDYLAGKASPFPFHLTNILLQAANSFLLGLCMHLASRRIIGKNNFFFAIVTCAVFAAWPMHCEVASWIISRVDSQCLFYFLASYALYLRSAHNRATISSLSLLLFVLALMSKEMAIVLPLLIVLTTILTPGRRGLGLIKDCFTKTLPYFAILLGYLGFRTIVLGTMTGGYQGSIGEGLSQSILHRWTDLPSIARIFLPFNIDIFGANSRPSKYLKTLYLIGLAIFVLAQIRDQDRKSNLKIMGLLAGWFLLTLLPIYQVFDLTPNLQGSRFLYFSTAPLCAAIAALFSLGAGLQFSNTFKQPATLILGMTRAVKLARYGLTGWLILLLVQVTVATNLPWIKAMKEVETFKIAVESELDKIGPNDRVAIINLPQSYKGSHMLYNAATMSVLFTPPLSKHIDLSGKDIDRIITFEPATYGDADLIDRTRFAATLADKANHIFSWDRKSLSLSPYRAKPDDHIQDQKPLATGQIILDKDHRITIDIPGGINPLDWDYLKIDSKNISGGANKTVIRAVFSDSKSKNKGIDGFTITGTEALHMSEHKAWLLAGNPDRLEISLNHDDPTSLHISQIALAKLANQRPKQLVAGKGLKLHGDGIARPTSKDINPCFDFDATNVPGVHSVMYEYSRPNSWFEHYTGSLRAATPSEQAKLSGTIDGIKGRDIPLSFSGLGDNGFYQLRLAALDKDGHIIGYFTDPLNFQM